MRKSIKSALAVTAASGLVAAYAGVAHADTIVLSSPATVSAAPGDTVTFTAYLVATSSPTNDTPGCNANPQNPVTMTFTSSNPGVADAPTLADPFTTCDDPATEDLFEGGQSVTVSVKSPSSGSTTITADAVGGRVQSGNKNNPPSSPGYDNTDSLVINVTSGTIDQAALTFSPASPQVYHHQQTLAATGGSTSNTIVYSTSTPTVCSLSGAVLTMDTGVGVCTVTATRPGNATYNDVSATANVDAAKETQTITIVPGSISGKTYGDAPFAISATSDSGLAVALISSTIGVCTYADSMVTILHAGTCTVDAAQAGNDNYLAASASSTGSIEKATLTVTAPTVSVFLNAPSPALSPTYSGFVIGQHAPVADTAADLGTAPTCSSAANLGVIGTYSTTCGNGVDGDYAFSYVDGVLTVDYKYSGFLQPINPDRSSSFKSGSTIPVKFQLLDYNNVVQNVGNIAFTLAVNKLDPYADYAVNENVGTTVGDSGYAFRWDATSMQYIYNLSTKTSAMGAGTYALTAKKAGQAVVSGQINVK